MPTLGVNVAIIQEQKILLTKRRDFEVWCLPGGGVDDGESIGQAAQRETREETGLEVNLERLVGIYSRPGWLEGGLHVVVFTAVITGGKLHLQENEVIEAGYFSAQDLPDAMLLGHRRRIMDALSGARGMVWFQDALWPFPPGITRQDLYNLCAQSGLPPSEFYLRYVGQPGPYGEKLETRCIDERA
jgi:ADP-ribose pyrophosphatase YjhB (NUDIX family)